MTDLVGRHDAVLCKTDLSTMEGMTSSSFHSNCGQESSERFGLAQVSENVCENIWCHDQPFPHS